MGVTSKLIDQIEIKAVGDLFHETIRDKPHSVSTMIPEKAHGRDLLEGAYGKEGSVVNWHFTHDGKSTYAKQRIEAIDEEKKSIVYKTIEGDLLELYKSFIITYHVDDTGGDNHLVTWTLEYEKMNEDTPYPTTLMKFFLELTKDMEAHYLATPKLVVQP